MPRISYRQLRDKTMTVDSVWQKARAEFDRDGFTVVKEFLSGQDRHQLLEQVDRYLRDVMPTMDPKMVFFEDKTRPDTFIYVQNMERHDAYFKKFLEEGPCRQLAECLFGQPAAPKGASIFNKPPRIGRGTPPHQDASYWMIDPNEALTLWIAIDRSDESNGCVHYVRGSHKAGLRSHEPSNAFGFSRKISDYASSDERAEVAVPIEPGDLIAHHCVTIHRTEDNPSDRSRRAIGLVYYSQRVKVDEVRRKAHTQKLKQNWAEADKL